MHSDRSLQSDLDLRSVRSDLSECFQPSVKSTPARHIFTQANATGSLRSFQESRFRNYRGGRAPNRPPPGPRQRIAPLRHQIPRTQTNLTASSTNDQLRNHVQSNTISPPSQQHQRTPDSSAGTAPIPGGRINNPYKTQPQSDPKHKTA